jgi:tetratricopeptide (TPR) repeat protein
MALVLIATTANFSQSQQKYDGQAAPLLEGLGNRSHPISTSSELAQRFFDQGLMLTFGFNHMEAERSFKEAARLDPECAMCYWGAALVLGPNINTSMDPSNVPEAYENIRKAVRLSDKAGNEEKALIDALSERYGKEPKPADDLIYPLGVWLYARGMAYARTGNTEAAQAELAFLEKIALNPVLAITLLREAVATEDNLAYNEPPDWFFPARHSLGAVLIEAGRFKEAPEAYREDLKRYPENGWALCGLIRSMEEMGNLEGANSLRARFEKAWVGRYPDNYFTSLRHAL